jgi:hypothetical protein
MLLTLSRYFFVADPSPMKKLDRICVNKIKGGNDGIIIVEELDYVQR